MILDELLPLERRGWDALCAGTGGDHYGALMTEDAVMVLINGHALDRAEVIASLDGAPAWDRYEIREERLIEVDQDTATLVYLGIAHRGEEPPLRALMSSTYTRRDGRWRLTLYQQTLVPGA